VQQVGIDHLDAQVIDRAGEGLLDLERDRGVRIVGQAVILPRPGGELRLEEQAIAAHQAAGEGRRDGLPDRRLVVMATLVGGIEPRNPCSRASVVRRCVWSSFQAVPYRKRGTRTPSIDKVRSGIDSSGS
jgi:hypothetical protein